MRSKRAWTFQSFFLCFLFSAVLLIILFFMARQALTEIYRWVDPFLTGKAGDLPQDLHLSLTNLEQTILKIKRLTAPIIFGLGGGLMLMLWLLLQFSGRRLLNQVYGKGVAEIGPSLDVVARDLRSEAELGQIQASPQGAFQMLSILQRQGRLVDFLHEDLSLYDDSQIGAAVRNIHQGCKEVLDEYVQLEPIFAEEEGSEVAVPPGFDARAIRLTGNLTGEGPPFRGILRHRGWCVTGVQLPHTTMKQEKDWILAAAEVELV